MALEDADAFARAVLDLSGPELAEIARMSAEDLRRHPRCGGREDLDAFRAELRDTDRTLSETVLRHRLEAEREGLWWVVRHDGRNGHPWRAVAVYDTREEAEASFFRRLPTTAISYALTGVVLGLSPVNGRWIRSDRAIDPTPGGSPWDLRAEVKARAALDLRRAQRDARARRRERVAVDAVRIAPRLRVALEERDDLAFEEQDALAARAERARPEARQGAPEEGGDGMSRPEPSSLVAKAAR